MAIGNETITRQGDKLRPTSCFVCKAHPSSKVRMANHNSINVCAVVEGLVLQVVVQAVDEVIPRFVPMLMGSAYKNKGVQNLLDAVARSNLKI